MNSGRRLVVITRVFSRAAESAIAGWRSLGVKVDVLDDLPPRELVSKLDAHAFEAIVLWSPQPELEHALGRSLRHQKTPVTVFFESDEGLSSGAHLDLPFHQDAIEPTAPARAWDLALRRLIADPRVRFVFRTRWHAEALAERLQLDSFPRSAVIPPGLPALEQDAATPGQPVRVLFKGTVNATRRSGADLFVRTMIELSHRPRFDELELVLIEGQVSDEEVLKPLEGLPVRRLPRAKALATSKVALVTARDGSRIFDVLQTAARGVVPVAPAHPALEELSLKDLPSEDPAELADAVRTLLDQPSKCAARASALIKALARRSTPKVAAEAELELIGELPPARTRAPAAKEPVLTVAVPAWNASAHLERCVASIMRADRPALIEVVIVDDGSTDDTFAVANRLASEHGAAVRVVRQENKGHGGAINTAMREARGAFFRVVDADDWVDSLALRELAEALQHERADLVLTGYAEDRPDEPLAVPVNILGRLPAGALTRFDTAVDPLYGFTSWGPLLSTSTFRTALLRKSKLTLTERSSYVDLEYCTLGLEHVETLRHLPLELYRYSLDVQGQSVTPESYRKRFRQHEAVITRLCEFVRDGKSLSAVKRKYIAERVIGPVVVTHLNVLSTMGDAQEAKEFRKRMSAFKFVPLPQDRVIRELAARAAKAALPERLVGALAATRERNPATLARELGRYVLPSGLTRFLGR